MKYIIRYNPQTGITRTPQEVEKFKKEVYAYAEKSGVTDSQRQINAKNTAEKFVHDWNNAGIPKDYKYEIYSIARTPDQQIQTYADGWKAVAGTQHILGLAVDIHVWKNNQRVTDKAMENFFFKYVKGKILRIQVLYPWGFHTNYKNIGVSTIQKKAAAIGSGLVLLGIGLAIFFLSRKGKA